MEKISIFNKYNKRYDNFMITIQGYFADLNDNYVNVLIEKQSEESATYSINEDGCGIYFAGDEPVSIIQDVENEF